MSRDFGFVTGVPGEIGRIRRLSFGMIETYGDWFYTLQCCGDFVKSTLPDGGCSQGEMVQVILIKL